jgi:hypothetical protein
MRFPRAKHREILQKGRLACYTFGNVIVYLQSPATLGFTRLSAKLKGGTYATGYDRRSGFRE